MRGKNLKNIEQAVRDNLCTGCGTCAGVCGKNAIKMRLNKLGVYVPALNKELCDNCGLCVRVCPGYDFNYIGYHRKIHGALPKNTALGPCISAYSGHSTDPEILKLSQSGGFVSSLLLFCLEKKIIDGVVVTQWRNDAPFEPRTFIARSRAEILSATGSKYHPVPASRIVGEVLGTEGSFAFVGTACQIQGMRKAESLFPELGEKIKLYVGLHSLGVFNYYFHDYVLHKLRLERGDVAYFRHRDKSWRGWPCDLLIKDTGGMNHNMDYRDSRINVRPYFTPWRCMLCFDKANEFSDVSCGDCRVRSEHKYFAERGYDVRQGISEFVVRTGRACDIISEFLKEGRFIAHQIDENSVTGSIGVAGKKLGLDTFGRIASLFGTGIPEYGVRFSTTQKPGSSPLWTLRKVITPVVSCHYYVLFLLMRYSAVRWIMQRTPLRIYRRLNSLRKKFTLWQFRDKCTELQISLQESIMENI